MFAAHRVGRLLVGAFVLATLAWHSPGASAAAFVRVDQVGYDRAAGGRAFVVASASEAGAAWDIVASGGATVASGTIGPNVGGWNAAYPFVHALDIPAGLAAGTYSIAVGGAQPATSPAFELDTPRTLFEPLLSNARLFFEAQRDGANVIPGTLARQPAHLNDAGATTYDIPVYTARGTLSGDLVPISGAASHDVSGGWADAGDYVKFVETTSYAETMLLVALRDRPDVLGPGAPADLSGEAAFGLDWLLKTWDDGQRTLYYQVGIGDGNSRIAGDHDIWRLPQADDTWGGTDPLYRYIRNRPALRAGSPGSPVSPNLAGRDAAAFALCFQVYRDSDPPLAGRCLLAAEHVFDLADPAPTGLLTVSPFDFYPETSWAEDLELGAAELYFALAEGGLPPGLPHVDPAFYLQASAHWAAAYLASPDADADTLNLYDVSALAHRELHRAIAQAGGAGLEVTQADLVGSLRAQLDGAVAIAASDPFGFGFDFSQWDAVSHGMGLAITASFVDELASSTAHADFQRHQLDVLLGSNAWGSSFIVGAGSTFPHCMQHQVANLVGALDGTTPLLVGAAVNGPNSPQTGLGMPGGARACPPSGTDPFAQFNGRGAQYLDDVSSWPTVEPAIDFAAAEPLAFALAIPRLAAPQEAVLRNASVSCLQSAASTLRACIFTTPGASCGQPTGLDGSRDLLLSPATSPLVIGGEAMVVGATCPEPPGCGGPGELLIFYELTRSCGPLMVAKSGAGHRDILLSW